MKISEIDKAKSDLRRRKLVIGGTDSEQIMLLIDSHDTQSVDMDRVLAALEPLAEEWGWRIGIGDLPNEIPERIRIAHELYTELIKTYRKVDKNG